jgi:hypothetical protein
VTRGTDLGDSGKKGLTGVGGSTSVQTERRGVTVVEQRSSPGCWQGGRGSSQHWCGARGSEDGAEGWPEWPVPTEALGG